MTEIRFSFPIESDAYNFRNEMTTLFRFFATSSPIDISSISKNNSNPERPIWCFSIIDSTDNDDKVIDIYGGSLDLMNGTKHVWAFS